MTDEKRLLNLINEVSRAATSILDVNLMRILSKFQGKEVELLRNLGEIGTTFQKSSTSPLFFGEDTLMLTTVTKAVQQSFGFHRAVVAYELRNPVAGIAAGVNYLSKKIPRDAAGRQAGQMILRENEILEATYRKYPSSDVFCGCPVYDKSLGGKQTLC